MMLSLQDGPGVTSYSTYMQKSRAIIASKNLAAMQIKLADMLGNTGHPTNDYSETIELMRAGLQAGRG